MGCLAPGKYPGYMTEGLPSTQYKAIEKYKPTYQPYSNNGPSHIQHLGGKEYPCDEHNPTCEAYLTHFKSCQECQSKIKGPLDNKEGFVGDMFGVSDDTSDIIMFVLGALLVYMFMTRMN